MTLRTHALPATFGLVHWKLTATSDDAFRRLLDRFVALYAEGLFNPNWGEQASARPGNRFEVTVLFQGLDEAQARSAWAPLTDFVAAHADEYQIEDPLLVAVLSANKLWDGSFMREHMPSAIRWDDRREARSGRWGGRATPRRSAPCGTATSPRG